MPRLRRLPRRVTLFAGSALLGLIPLVAACTAPPPPPPAPQARGIDVSNWQHPGGVPIDWGAVRASGVEFAFIKATEGPVGCTGNYYTNSWFRRDWSESSAAGLYRGAYHFARPGDVGSAIAQARYFVNAVGAMNGPRDLPPVLDLEQSCGLDAPALAAFAKTWVDEVFRLTGRTPIVYTYYYFWRDTMRSEPSLAHLPLWIATYGPKPLVPAPWHQWTFWQYTSSGQVPGISGNVDLNWFAWNSETLARFVVEGASNPRGHLDLATGGPASIRIAGWALDLDNPAPIEVHAYVAGRGTAIKADLPRPDVGAVYGTAGPAHGFDATLHDVPPGRQQVCVFAINVGPGTNIPFACRTVDVAPVEPYGVLDVAVAGPGRIDVSGWAHDPDTPAPIPVHVWVDGKIGVPTEANRPRPDVAAVHPALGPNRGFATSVTGLPRGPHEVCVFAINVAGKGNNTVLGCRKLTVG